MLRTIRQYPTLPSLPARGPMPPIVSVIMPLARTNLITNPSFETATTGWATIAGGISVARSAAQQYHGTYSGEIVYGSLSLGGGAAYALSLTAGTPYAFSIKVREPVIGRAMRIAITDISNNAFVQTPFRATGRWQWVWVIFTPPTTTTYYCGVTATTIPSAGTFYLDGAQVESLSDGILQPTTYIDGDQLGLLVGQQPPAYGWNGTPHASTSYRSALTRAGGYSVNLNVYNFLLTSLIGLGMAAPNNVSIPYTVLDGARFQRTTKPPRTISLAGRFQADDAFALMQSQSDMRQAFDRDLVGIQQPLILQVEPQDECGNVIGDFAQVQCLYAGGLEGNDGNLPAEDAAPTFTMYVPYITGGDAGASLTVQQTVTNTNVIAQRSALGVWSAMSTGMSSGGTPALSALARGLDGTIYAGGSFTDAGGSGADNIAQWNGTSWAVLGSATALNSDVAALAVGANGVLYVGGGFTNASGIAAADFVATWNGSAWGALSTGADASVLALAFAPSGTLYAGGTFANIGGGAAARIASWNGSAWSALGTGMNNSVLALAVAPNGTLYAGGTFTTSGGVTTNGIAAWNGSAWSALGTGMSGGGPTVSAIAIGPDGRVYAGGNFTAAGGVSAASIAVWNGTGWSPLGSGVNGVVDSIKFGADGRMYVGGTFTTAGGITLPDRFAVWNGSTWLPADVDLPSTARVFSILPLPDGGLVTGFNTSGSATSAAITTVTNSAPGLVYPRLVINGPSSGTSRIYQIVNYTTGIGVWLNLTLSPGEVATLDFNPQAPSFTTTFQGDISSKILPGSQPALFYLAQGANSVSFFAASSTVTATFSWQKRYNGVADLVN